MTVVVRVVGWEMCKRKRVMVYLSFWIRNKDIPSLDLTGTFIQACICTESRCPDKITHNSTGPDYTFLHTVQETWNIRGTTTTMVVIAVKLPKHNISKLTSKFHKTRWNSYLDCLQSLPELCLFSCFIIYSTAPAC